MTSSAGILDRVNANNFELLYRCRWSPDIAQEIVPELGDLLGSPDAEVVAEALRALFRIGPAAHPAMDAVYLSTSHPDAIVRNLATTALGQISLEHPAVAVPLLVEASDRPDLLEPALFALIRFGPAAVSAAPLFRRTFESRSAKLRRLAVRGLRACQAGDAGSQSVLERARSDPNGEVRKAASSRPGCRRGARVAGRVAFAAPIPTRGLVVAASSKPFSAAGYSIGRGERSRGYAFELIYSIVPSTAGLAVEVA